MLPIPRNLKGIIKAVNNENTEFRFYGELVCRCQSKKFEILYVGDSEKYKEKYLIKLAEIEGEFYLIFKSKCIQCNEIYNLFDKDYNGWNGYVCKGFGKRQNPRPIPEKWYCITCSNSMHKIRITIYSKGKKDFIEETQGEFDEEYWEEAFSWICVEIKCSMCSLTSKEWISYETL